MRLSVIVCTCNQPEWLELVLWGLSVQTCGGFELLIADDGSDDRTGATIRRLRVLTSLRPVHVWHEARGFRKCTILNRAIAQAGGDYIVFLDGDCVPRADFVARHTALAERGRFISGGAVRLTREMSILVTPADVVGGQVHDWRWLRSRGMRISREVLKLMGRGGCGERVSIARALDVLTPTKATFNGGNSSAWRDDLLRVNGFDERMGHGGLDRELGERLENAGVCGKQARHRCVCVHLDHPRDYASPAVKAFNNRLRQQSRAACSEWTSHGIEKSSAGAA